MLFYLSKVEAYGSLVPLQGSAVPAFYGSGTLDLSISDPGRSLHPPVVLMEYTNNAVTLKDLDTRTLDRSVIRSFVGAMHRLRKLGVCHGDLNLGNYLFAPAHKPARAVLIDFADSVVRDPVTSDDLWEDIVHENGAVRETKKRIGWRFTAAGLPIPEECVDWQRW